MKCFLALLLLLMPPESPSGVRAEVTDPVGDAMYYFTDLPFPDLRSAEVEVSRETGLVLRVRFVPDTFDSATSYVQFNLDLADNTDPCERCGSHLVDINGLGGTPGDAQVRRLGPDSEYEIAGTVPVTFVADGADVVIPWSLLPKNIDRLSYRVVTCIKLRDDALSRILDSMPDAELPRAVLE